VGLGIAVASLGEEGRQPGIDHLAAAHAIARVVQEAIFEHVGTFRALKCRTGTISGIHRDVVLMIEQIGEQIVRLHANDHDAAAVRTLERKRIRVGTAAEISRDVALAECYQLVVRGRSGAGELVF